MTRLPLPLALGLALAVAGCASTHDLAQGPNVWGGGVYREQVQPGLHYIVVKSNVAPWTNRDAVAAQWQQEAVRLCGGGHRALRVQDLVEEEREPMSLAVLSLPYLITVRKGYALCETAQLSIDSAERILDARQ
jgi:hypothetical protein